MLGVDAPHLYERNVVDGISHISIHREGNSPSNIREQLTQVLGSTFAFIDQKIQ